MNPENSQACQNRRLCPPTFTSALAVISNSKLNSELPKMLLTPVYAGQPEP